MHLARFPRVRLAHLSTPLEPMERLSKELGVELWIKRDDCTGMSTGGNKTRALLQSLSHQEFKFAWLIGTSGAGRWTMVAFDPKVRRLILWTIVP